MTSNKTVLHYLLFALISLLTTLFIEATVWVILALSLAFVISKVFSEVRTEGEGGLLILSIVFWATPILLGIGVIPAYLVSMHLAKYLREKHGWEIKHPRRLFLVSLATPIIILILLSALA